ncbi:FtsX-like permease family protein [Demequina gelatinilytica]|uniref:FtsX-like permease family protein n=1 Tax=Demequina gelatinilytica TaxID=1638980 RepID=UPI0007836AD9|nr:FtsX-like permease family protein [Demequina gelatinilytica]
MRNAASWSLVAAGVTLGLVAPPLWQPADGGFGYSPMLGIALLPVLTGLIAAVTGTLRSAHLATRRAELASRSALGQSRTSLIGAEARRGVAAGGVWGLGALLAGSVTRQLVAGFGGAAPDWLAAVTLTFFAIALVSGAALGWTASAAWATRGRGEDDAPAGQARRRRPRWTWVAGGFALLGLACVATGWPDVYSAPFEVAVAIAAAIGLYLALPALLVRWGALLGARIVMRFAALLGKGADPASARALGSHALVRPAPLRAAAIGAIGFVIAAASGATVAINGNAARNDVAQTLAPDAVVASVATLGEDASSAEAAPGWAPALDPAIVAALEADPRLVVVPAAALTTSVAPLPGDLADYDGQLGGGGTILAVENDSLDGLGPSGLRAAYLGDAVVIDVAPEVLVVGDVDVRVDTPAVAAPFAAIERTWAEETFGPAPDSALLVYAASSVPRAPGDASQASDVHDVLAGHALEGAYVSASPDYYWPGESRADAWSLTLLAGPFLLGAVAIVVVLAAATQRLRAREHATLVALGAQARTMRAAAALEAAVVTGVGAVLGLVAGLTLGLATSSLNGAGGGAIRLWNIGFDLTQVPWAALIGLAALSVGLAAGLAALVRVRADALSPAEQLRDAEKEGVL